jgi:hypothetical protein
MPDVILAMSISVNIPKWKERAEAIKSDYHEGQLDGIEVYFPPVGTPYFSQGDIRFLRKKLEGEITDSKRPLYVGGHLAHGDQGFNLNDGLTEQNQNCIDSAVNGAGDMGAKHLVVHAGGRFPGQPVNMDNIKRVFDYLADKLKDTGCIAIIENMYKGLDDPREPLYCSPGEDMAINKIG